MHRGRFSGKTRLSIFVGLTLVVATALCVIQPADSASWWQGIAKSVNNAQRAVRKTASCPACVAVAAGLKKYGKDIFAADAKPTEAICEPTGGFAELCARILVDVRKNHLTEEMNPLVPCRNIGLCLRLDDNGQPIIDMAPNSTVKGSPTGKGPAAEDEDQDENDDDKEIVPKDEEDEEEEEEEDDDDEEEGKRQTKTQPAPASNKATQSRRSDDDGTNQNGGGKGSSYSDVSAQNESSKDNQEQDEEDEEDDDGAKITSDDKALSKFASEPSESSAKAVADKKSATEAEETQKDFGSKYSSQVSLDTLNPDITLNAPAASSEEQAQKNLTGTIPRTTKHLQPAKPQKGFLAVLLKKGEEKKMHKV